jgi:hypothetical protein
MRSITDLYSSAYLTAIGMNNRRQHRDPFDELDGERPMPRSLFSRVTRRVGTAIATMRKLWLRPERDLLADSQLRF